MYPIFVFAKCNWSAHSKVVKLGKNAHCKQRKATPTQTLQFHVTFMQMPCQFITYCIWSIFSIYGLVWFNISNSSKGKKAEKLIKIYRFNKAEEDNQQNLLKLFELLGLLCFLQVLHMSLLFVLFHAKLRMKRGFRGTQRVKKMQLTVQVSCLIYF